ncbi:MAG: AIR carboxylase family protein [Myxococcales bacterium]|nr:AIR carboxylase family protein [Myxococcales bacterium]
MQPLVPILMGSKSDLEHGRKIADALHSFGIESQIRVCSAHKVPAYALELLATYEAMERPIVYVTIAGRSNALSGLVDAQVSRPVVACPPTSSSFGGADIFSSLRMPSGVTPAVVLEPKNAALLVAKMLALTSPGLREKVAAAQQVYRDEVTGADRELNP